MVSGTVCSCSEALPLPLLANVRRAMSILSCGWHFSDIPGIGSEVMTARTSQASSRVWMWFSCARRPAMNSSARTRLLFPAPLSPVMTMKLPPKLSEVSLMPPTP